MQISLYQIAFWQLIHFLFDCRCFRDLHNNLAYFYTSIGDNKKAIDLYEQSLKLQSDDGVKETIARLKKDD